ncbi:hypothetical protein AAG570_000203, partial [Ranatra chinensis]
AEDLIINPKDFPNIHKGDIVEIYHPEDEFSRLLLQITTFKEDLQGKDTISIEKSIATTFQLYNYNDVYVNLVNPENVALDSVELTFKDQYLGRSEMWRLKKSLVNTCVYLNKKLEFCGGSARCQVYEMWSKGDRVACGVIKETTKVVFRSSSGMVHLFLQMSSEMWDFDIHGDLYFEKAVNGFMADLFQKWKKHGSNHEVTVVLFSRVYYKANTLDEFPRYMQECLQQDYKGRFYEDFYRVVVQNERYDDWSNTLVELRRLFSDYRKAVLQYHVKPGVSIPKGFNSTAAQGNFLEVLNMSLNVFEKHYLDRSFDRTGQLSVVITPGVGVFEVDREVTNVTKQRIIDNGVGSDLVCLGEQPLHAVPLLKFYSKDSSVTADDYSMPHWINLSFYSSNKKVAYSNFIPRIKLPPRRSKPHQINSASNSVRTKTLYEDEEPFANSVVDYDAYDAQVFALPTAHTSKNVRLLKKTSVSALDVTSKVIKRKMSDPDIHYCSGESSNSPLLCSRSAAVNIPHKFSGEEISVLHTPSIFPVESNMKIRPIEAIADTCSPPNRNILVGSSPTSPFSTPLYSNPPPAPRPARALINPFDPSHITIKLTSNRRRWAHIFPKGPSGLLIQQHHYQVNQPSTKCNALSNSPGNEGKELKMKNRPSILTLAGGLGTQTVNRKSLTLLWGATGEQEWTPALTTVSKVLIGVDWKSLTIPACLPITTDYFPDDVCLRTDYVFSDYNLLPDDVNADCAQLKVIYRKPLTTPEVFQELISQRLSQGFQIIIDGVCGQTPGIVTQGSVVVGTRPPESLPSSEYKLSIGRVFHRLSLNGSEIRVTRYRPRHPYPPFNFHYRYRFQAPDHDTYDVSWVSFTTEKLENFNWNCLDHYICTRGDTEFTLMEALKYWRVRVYLLPLRQAVTKRIFDGAEHCNIYPPHSASEQASLAESFLRFIETWVNKIRRPPNYKKQKLDLSGFNVPNHLNRRRHSTGIIFLKSNIVGNSPFRERLGSNRLPDKPRPRSGSKVLERGRVSPATDISMPLSSASDSDHPESDFEIVMLKEGSTHIEILEVMKNPLSGVGFLSQHSCLPSYTFVSADAMQWLLTHVEGITSHQQALSIMQSMLNEKLICHASGNNAKEFIVGFYLYFIVHSKDEAKGDTDAYGICDPQSFENEWVEVEVQPTSEPPILPTFLANDLPPPCSHDDQKGPMNKEAHLDIDVQNKSDRMEWGHVKYHSVYQADKAYEMIVQWVAASGCIVADLVFGWARKAQACSLQMIPIPADPFAIPGSSKSDPLRGPVFIPLDTESLMGTKSYLFEEFDEETWAQRLILFQDAIAVSFGFISCRVENTQRHNQYVHVSGNVFLRIPSLPCEHTGSESGVSRSRPVRRQSASSDTLTASPHHEFITRHVSSPPTDLETRVGFLWSWNHIVSRRWRLGGSTNALCDEPFQNKLLSDFKEFCSNQNNRLKAYWDSSWAKVKQTATEDSS